VSCSPNRQSLSSDDDNRQDYNTLQHCLEWVMRVYTSKLTPDSVVTYLLHDCERSLWLFCLVWHGGCDDQSRVHFDWQHRRLPVLLVWAVFEGLTEFCFVFRFSFRASLLESLANRAVTRLLLLRRCMKCFSVFYSEYSRARPSTGRSGQVIDSMCMSRFFRDSRGRSAVRAQPCI